MQEASSQVEDVDTEIAEAQGSAANDTAAALVASLLTSVIEAPVELFRHRMQVTFVEDKGKPEHLACIYLMIQGHLCRNWYARSICPSVLILLGCAK